MTNNLRKLDVLLVIAVLFACLSMYVSCQVKQLVQLASGYEGETE